MVDKISFTFQQPLEVIETYIRNKMNDSSLGLKETIKEEIRYGFHKTTIMVYEKYLYRLRQQVILTIILTSDGKECNVIAISSGKNRGLFNMAWGRNVDFMVDLRSALSRYNGK